MEKRVKVTIEFTLKVSELPDHAKESSDKLRGYIHELVENTPGIYTPAGFFDRNIFLEYKS